MDLKKIIEDTLDISVIEAFYPVIPPCATYYLATDENGISGDGQEEEGIENYQIDIWDRRRDFVVKGAKKLKSELAAHGVTIPNISYSYDNNGKIWRATLTFSCIREEQ